MALGESTNAIYLKISDGKVRRKANEGEEGVTSRTLTIDGETRTLFEKVYNSVSGNITAIYKSEHEQYGVSWSIVLVDGDETYSVQISETSRYFQSFAMLIPNIDFSQKLTIKPYSIAVKGKEYKNQGITIYQNGNKVANFYKTYDPETKKSTPKNGLEKFDWDKAVKKSQKDILKIQIREFFSDSMEKYVEELKEYIDSKVDEPKEVVEEDVPY